jgi:tyrosine-specific transport protein
MLQGLLVVAAGGVNAGSLASGGDWSAVPATLPVVALAFVYHNIIPVICTALEGDVAKIRTAVLAGELLQLHCKMYCLQTWFCSAKQQCPITYY